MVKRLWFASLVLVVLLSTLAACAQPSPAPTTSPSPAPSPSPSPKPSPSPTAAPAPSPKPSPSPSPTAVKPIVLKWGYYPAIGDIRSTECEKAIGWLQERSNGRIKIQYFPAEQLYNANELWNATRDGLVDIGGINTAAFAGIEPVLELGAAPRAFTMDNYISVFRKDGLIDQVLAPAFRKHNMLVVWGVGTGSQVTVFRKKVRTLEDVKGLKMRSVGGGVDRYFQLLGATAVRIASSEVYVAAQRGTIDGANHGLTSYVSWKEWEVLPYLVDDKFGSGFTTMAVNLNSFNSLPADLQKLVKDTFLDVEADWIKNVTAYENEQFAMLKTKSGLDFYVLPPDEFARWVAANVPYWDEFAKRVGEPGAKAVAIMKNYWK